MRSRLSPITTRAPSVQVGEQEGCLAFRASCDVPTEQHHAGDRVARVGEQRAEVGVLCEEHPMTVDGRLQDHGIRSAPQAEIACMHRVVARVGQQGADSR